MTGPSPQLGNSALPTHSLPQEECDLVMKGGITSGIVYPPAIEILSRKYRFRSIGGTSVGAMAAATISAAEFYRQKTNSSDGFHCLSKDVKEWLRQDSNLLNLFQPTPQTQPLLEFVLGLLPTTRSGSSQSQPAKSSRLQSIGRFFKAWIFHSPFGFSWSALVGAVLGLLLFAPFPLAAFALFSLLTHRSVVLSFWPFLTLLTFVVIGVWLGWQSGNVIGALLSLPENSYGICTGYTPTSQDKELVDRTIAQTIANNRSSSPTQNRPASPPTAAPRQSSSAGQSKSTTNSFPTSNQSAFPHSKLDYSPGAHTSLTDWLTYTISCISGQQPNEPLTIGDLSSKKIDLKMVTTNLSQTLPYIMPEGLRNFIFNAEEMVQFFPSHIVQYMIEHPPTRKNASQQQRPALAHPYDPDQKLQLPIPPAMLPDGYYFLPDPENLPVVFCARLSLSFPILLSAVPLYTIDSQAYQIYKENPQRFTKQDLQKNWFSDGGICSNFPIHFFDAWLPSRPTLGINLLTTKPTATCILQDDPEAVVSKNASEDVFLLEANARPDPEWNDVDGLLQFGLAMFGTAQNYRDMLQADLPSYRERIAQIRLTPDEGGLHLKTDAKAIDDMSKKGEKAGEKIVSTFDFEQHTWVRFLVLMAQLEKNVGEIENQLNEINNLLSKPLPNTYPYQDTKTAQLPIEAQKHINDLLTFIQAWKKYKLSQDMVKDRNDYPCFFRLNEPLPRPVLRVRPGI